MKSLNDLSFEGEFTVRKDFELIQVEEVERRKGYFLISLVDSFFNRFVIGSLATDAIAQGSMSDGGQANHFHYFVLRNLVDNKGKLVSSKIIKSKLNSIFLYILILLKVPSILTKMSSPPRSRTSDYFSGKFYLSCLGPHSTESNSTSIAFRSRKELLIRTS